MERILTEWEKQVTTLAKEVFLIAEWVAVIAAFIIAGNKLNAPLAVFFGFGLSIVAFLYLGVKVDILLAYARYRDKPREFSKSRSLFAMAVSSAFGLAVATLIKTMIAALA